MKPWIPYQAKIFRIDFHSLTFKNSWDWNKKITFFSRLECRCFTNICSIIFWTLKFSQILCHGITFTSFRKGVPSPQAADQYAVHGLLGNRLPSRRWVVRKWSFICVYCCSSTLALLPGLHSCQTSGSIRFSWELKLYLSCMYEGSRFQDPYENHPKNYAHCLSPWKKISPINWSRSQNAQDCWLRMLHV